MLLDRQVNVILNQGDGHCRYPAINSIFVRPTGKTPCENP